MNEISEHKIIVPKTARYFSIGTPSEKIRHVIFVIHGYGHLAKNFIEWCRGFEAEDTLIIAPEGLSRYYVGSGFEKVGASWMTKEDRLSEIDDHVNYLDLLWEKIKYECGSEVTLSVLGFSQGVPTAWRWVLKGKATPDHLICWGGGVPAEGEMEMKEKLKGKTLIGVFGEKDEFISKETREQIVDWMKKINAGTSIHLFPGKHVLDDGVIEIIRKEIFK